MNKVIACLTCGYYRGLRKCEAFPEGIPDEILEGKSLHTLPYPGDNGIMYRKEGEQSDGRE